MKLKAHCLLSLLIILGTSCGPNYRYWDISKFHMNPSALKDMEEIKLIYTSQGPDQNTDLEYYIHLMAVSLETGDTVNILTTGDNGIKKSDNDATFNYFDQNNFATKVIQMDVDNIEVSDLLAEIDEWSPKQINKVARDPKFDFIADNTYPTVIGSIGTIKPSEE